MPECNRCGLCCFYRDDEGNIRKCAMLVKVGDKTLCRIYLKRLGHRIYKSKSRGWLTCHMIEDIKINFPGCPFNKEGQKEF